MNSGAKFERHAGKSIPWPAAFGPADAGPLKEECRRALTARRVLAAGDAGSEHLGNLAFGNPALEILLDIYLRESGGCPSSVAEVTSAQNLPESTAARWLNHLTQQGAVRRHYRSEVHGEVVELTLEGRNWVESYLDALAGA